MLLHLEVRKLRNFGVFHNVIRAYNLGHFQLNFLKHSRVTNEFCQGPFYRGTGRVYPPNQCILNRKIRIKHSNSNTKGSIECRFKRDSEKGAFAYQKDAHNGFIREFHVCIVQ